jgi:hypothetical protein
MTVYTPIRGLERDAKSGGRFFAESALYNSKIDRVLWHSGDSAQARRDLEPNLAPRDARLFAASAKWQCPCWP